MSTSAQLRASLAACFSFLTLLAGVQAGAVLVARRTAVVGFFATGAQEFSDDKYFLNGQTISQVAFTSSQTTSQSGLTVWYGSQAAVHGLSNVASFSQTVNVSITEVSVQWIAPQSFNNQSGYFVSLTLSGSGQSYQLGQSTASANTVTFSAPAGAYLGGFAGMATGTAINFLQVIWVKPAPATVTVVGASTPYYTTGSTANATYFDDSSKALTYGSLSLISTVLAGQGGSGITFTYAGFASLSYGATAGAMQSPVIQQNINRIQGTYVSGTSKRRGYWGSLVFITTDGKRIKFGTPIAKTVDGYRGFDYQARKGQFLGAVKGWANSTQLLSISFVFFKVQLA